MNRQINNRFREYTIALPYPIAEQIKQRAREQKVSEATLIKQLVAKGLVSTTENEVLNTVE